MPKFVRINYGGFFSFLLLLFICPFFAFAQDILKAKPHIIEEYSVFPISKTNTTYQKRLSRIEIYNLQGKLVEIYSFAFQGDSSYYHRIIRKYDEKGREYSTEEYKSETTKFENLVLPEPDEAGFKKINSNLKITLIYKLITNFNPDGTVKNHQNFDGHGELTSNYIYSYPRKGETQFIHIQNGVEESKTVSVYRKKERKGESITYKNNQPVYRQVYYYDNNSRWYCSEQFKLNMSPDGERVTEILQSKTFRTFEGSDKKEKKWETYSFDEIGSPTHFWIREANHITVYKYQPDKVNRVLQSEVNEEFQYDDKGGLIKYVRNYREPPNQEFYVQFISEKIIKYY